MADATICSCSTCWGRLDSGGVGLSYAVANALFGGSAEYVALGLKSIGYEPAFYWYVTATMVIAFLVSMRLPKQASYLHTDH